MEGATAEPGSAVGLRRLSIPVFLGLVIVYLAIIQGGGRIAASALDEAEHGKYTTSEEVIYGLLIPVGLSLLFVYGVVAALGWWRPVLVDDRPVQRWVWVVPVAFAITILVGINYPDLLDKDIGFVLLLLLGTQCVGFAEEGMFRGIGVTTFRVNGFSEGKVALWTSIVFGAVHLSNMFGGEGAGAFGQAVAVSFAGYFFYLTRRVSGSNVLNSVLHGLFDFTIVSSFVIAGDDDVYLGAMAPIAVYIVVGIILLIRRRHIEPAPAAATADQVPKALGAAPDSRPPHTRLRH